MNDETLTFDKSALTEPVDRAVARAQAQENLGTDGGGATARGFAAGAWFTGVGTAIGMALAAAAFVVVLVMTVRLFTDRGVALPFFVLAWAILALPYAYRRIARIAPQLRDTDDRWYRLARFAPANGLTHVLSERDPQRSAAVFAAAEGPQLDDLVTGSSPRPFEVANLRFHIGGGRARMDVAMGYAMFRVRATLPSMSIQSVTAHGGAAWRPEAPQSVIAVDEEFDRRFRVSCAPEDAAVVRGLLGAETRAALIDVCGDVDIQVVGDEVWFFARQDLRLQDPVVWEWVEDLSALLDHTLDPRSGTSAPPQSAERAVRRHRVLRGAGAGRPFMLGCLVPLVLSVAAVVIGAFVV
ncbi:MAG: hypothetical protein LBU78_08020 [Microbacterium sp.]|jgi:hypothetical protein|nr:hypothetical protein [Microbacterium sp.]